MNTRATFLDRFLAALIDGILWGMLTFLLATILNIPKENNPLGLLMVLVNIYFITTRGQTPGKMLLNIQVVRKTKSQKLTLKAAIMREVVGKFVSGITLGIGYLWMLWDKDKQTLHDKIADTVVIKIK